MIRRVTAVLLTLSLAGPAADVRAAGNGTIEGSVTVGDRPLGGATLAFVDLSTGLIHRTASDATGRFAASVPAGSYAVTTEGRAGLTIEHAPSAIVVDGGRAVTADIGLVAEPGAVLQDPSAQADTQATFPAAPTEPVTATTIIHDPIGCMIAGQFPLVNSRIEPAESVARARVYFKSAQSPNWYYVEATAVEGLGFSAKLPRPKIEASPVTYYIQATTTLFGDAQIGEISSIVVNDAGECQDKALAPIGAPGEVTVFSAATGAAIAPAGFAAGGLALTLGTIALVVGGAAAAGITAAVTVFNPEPPPPPPPPAPPTPQPTPRPVPSPSPSPSPVPQPTPPPGTPFR
jgi:carboxypeptidase family protein